MMGKFKKYKEYVPTNIDWIGEIPSSWRLMRLGSVFNERRLKVSDKDFPALSVTKNGIVPQLANAAKTNDGDNRKGVFDGDFVINSRSDRKGSSGLAKQDGSVSLINIVIKPIEIVPKYSEYLLKSYYFIENFYKNGHGIVADLWTTRYADMKGIRIPLPSKLEQKSIANFLDQKTTQIDNYIQLKEKTIALLQERKAAIINHAVTKGLDPKVEMKDSGIEWLGEIPKAWELKKLKWGSKTTSGSTPSSGNREEFYNGNIPWVRTTDLNGKELFDVPEKITSKALKYTACKIVPKNTVCVAMYGGPGTIGKHSILRFSGTVNQALCAVIPAEDILPDYLFYYLKFYRPIWMITAKGSRIDPNISQDEVRNMLIPYPPISEQLVLLKNIVKRCGEIDSLIIENKKEITLIKEYKESLISAVVTGKIDVRSY